MKRYYANLLGTWTDVTYGSQLVGQLPDDGPETVEHVDSEFVKIYLEEGMYIVHKSQIQVYDEEA